MIYCPYCEAENIEGADVCEQCGQSLDDLHLPSPATPVERSLLTDDLSTLQPRHPIAVSPQTTVGDVLSLLIEKRIGCVFVIERERFAGVFTEQDALMRLGTEIELHRDRPISDFMTPNPQQLAHDAKIAFAVRMMDLGGYRHVPVIDASLRPAGVISVRDILRYLTEKMTASGA